MYKIVTITVLFLFSNYAVSYSQSNFKVHSKGHAYFQWGWNRAAYTNSTITIKGDDYYLVLRNVKARDRPTRPFNFHNYLQLNRITIPQNNWRIGYFIKDNLALTFGSDHMKYVMVQNQTVKVDGNISRLGIYMGNYNSTSTVMTENFLTYEHTDGLNYVNSELETYHELTASSSKNFILNGMFGGGAGIMFPKTNVKFLDYERNDRFHISGFGVSAKAAAEVVFFKRIYLKFELKEGYINMPNIILHKKGINGKGNQDFLFTEFDSVLGWSFVAHKQKVVQKDEVF